MKLEPNRSHASRFKIFHDLMRNKVRHILLISTSYEAWIMEEDCRLSEQIVHEYRGLNLSRPPRLTWVSSISDALELLGSRKFDFVINISRTADREAYRIGEQIKRTIPGMQVVLLTHEEALPDVIPAAHQRHCSIDHIFFWTGNAEILLAIIKSIEDQINVEHDTQRAGIRIILFVEDSPFYLSSLLPILYRELVIETQAVIEDGLNEEHRLLCMRARPKILLAHSFEEALTLYQRFKSNVLGVISDVRFPRNGELDGTSGIELLKHIKSDRFDIPLLLASSEPRNEKIATTIPAVFVDKNSSKLNEEIRSFLLGHLGFGPFIFRMPDGRQVGKATDLYTLEQHVRKIPDESLLFHSRRNDFSRWLFTLAEVDLANRVRPIRDTDYQSLDAHRVHLVELIHNQRMQRQKGVIVNFDKDRFEPDTEFLKIGKGSLGGKARGLAFISSQIHRRSSLPEMFENVDIFVPQTVALTTEGFDDFIGMNQLGAIIHEEVSDEEIAGRFSAAAFPQALREQLSAMLGPIRHPLAVRSSSLLEDARFKAYAGLYKTYMLANDHTDLNCRLDQLIDAIKMVYASTYFAAPRAFAQRVGHRIENEKMAVMIQQVVGTRHGNHFYPAISGVAQSYNYYPFDRTRPEDGIASMALGLGKAVMEGGKTLRFSPRFPSILPQRSTVTDVLENAQHHFYSLEMGAAICSLGVDDAVTLAKREVSDAVGEYPVRSLSSTYDPQDNRIRDRYGPHGYPVVTFASVLNTRAFPCRES
jgi:DNA-binding NarL/FixJ family response regulator